MAHIFPFDMLKWGGCERTSTDPSVRLSCIRKMLYIFDMFYINANHQRTH